MANLLQTKTIKTFDISSGNQYISGYVEVLEHIYDNYITDNVTTVELNAYLRRTNTYTGPATTITNVNTTRYAYIDDQVLGGEEKYTKTIPNDKTYQLVYSASTSVYHNNDGSKKDMLVGFEMYNALEFPPFTVTKTTSTVTLTTIPRTTKAVNVYGTVEDSTTIKISPASPSFTHSVKLIFGENRKYLNANGGLSSSEVKLSGDSFKFNVPKAYYAEFTGTKKSGSVVFYTYSGSTQIGNETGTLTINVSATTCKPAISGTVKDVNPVTVALTNNENSLVNGRSNARITPSIRVSSVNDAYGYLTSTSIVNSKNETVDIKGLNFYDDANATKSGYVITAKNSRGGSASTTLNITGNFVPYKEVTIDNNGANSDLFDRVTETGNQVQAGFKGNFYAGYFDIANSANPNVLSLKWYVKKSEYDDWTLGGTFVEGTDYTINAQKNTYASIGEILLTSPFDDGTWDYKQKYYFKMVAIDLLNPIESPVVYNQYLKVGLPVINWYNKNDINHLNVNGELDINGAPIIESVEKQGGITSTSFRSYVKYADGTMIARGRRWCESVMGSKYGESWYTSGDFNFTDFLVPFVGELPEVTFNSHPASYSWKMLTVQSKETTLTNPGSIKYIYPLGNPSSPQGGYVGYTAIGRWK